MFANYTIRKSLIVDGTGMFAAQDIKKDEIIFTVNVTTGKLYEFNSVYQLPADEVNHAIQIGDHQWIGHPAGRNINHSCDPNCGARNSIEIVAMRNIKKGEELTLDYSTIEDSDWVMPEECQCGSLRCRKRIQSFEFLDKNIIDEYIKNGHLPNWIIQKYKL